MNAGASEPGLSFVTWLAHAALRLYPAAFRRAYAGDFVATVSHRWRRERANTRSAMRATARAFVVLCADTASAAPRAWRGASGFDPDAVEPPPPRRWLAGWGADARLATRLAIRQPIAALLVVLTLGLGIGLGVATFSALDRVILHPIAAPDGDRMVYLALKQPERGWQFSPPNELIARWRAGAKTVERIEIYSPFSPVKSGEGGAGLIEALRMSGGLPAMLSARPLLGRLIGPADAAPGAAPVVMLTERYWRAEYGGSPDVIGRTMRLNDVTYAIAGVWPDRVRFSSGGIPDILRVVPPEDESPSGDFALVLARLRPGVTIDAVERELTALIASVPDLPRGVVVAVNPPYGFLGPAFVTGLWMVFIAGAVLMAVAIVSAAHVLLARAASRAGELGVRMALGASMPRLVRLFFVESLLLTLAGLGVAAGVASAAGQITAAMAPPALPLGDGGWWQGRSLAFGGAMAAVSLLVCAAIPVWRARTIGVRDVLAGASGTRATDPTSRPHAVLVAAQAGLAVVLVAGAALMARSFTNLSSVDPGFALDRLAIISVQAPAGRYETAESATAFMSRVAEELAALPGVEGMTLANAPPFSASLRQGLPYLESESEPARDASTFVTQQGAPPGYFKTLGIPLVAGREFTSTDETGVVIVSESFARSHGGDVIGRRLRFSAEGPALAIVGVARNIKSAALSDSADRVQLYTPSGELGRYSRFILRTSGSPAALIGLARARVASIDPDVPLREATTGAALFDKQTVRHRFVAMLLGSLAALGMIFAVSGVYGVVSLDVGRRVREVGVRVALGATTGDVVRGIVGRSLRPVLAGAAIGSLAALWVGPWLEDLLFQVPARDPWSLAAGFALVALTAVAASSVPAHRASRVDPTVTLRAQ